MEGLENKLDGLFGKDAPVKMPENGKKTLAEWLPWISLVVGIIQLLVAWNLYHWAHAYSAIVDYANSVCQAFGSTADCAGSTSRWSIGLWIALIVVLIDAVLLLAAVPGLRARRKSGWNLAFYSVILNLVYGVVSVFTGYSGRIGSLIGSLIGAAIGLWLLFQVRSLYTAAGVASSKPTSSAPKAPDSPVK